MALLFRGLGIFLAWKRCDILVAMNSQCARIFPIQTTAAAGTAVGGIIALK
jgi:hypothetical protein